jgi:phosphatidate phosphatase APP1
MQSSLMGAKILQHFYGIDFDFHRMTFIMGLEGRREKSLMVDWKIVLATVVSNVEDHFDTLRFRLEQRLGWDKPVQIVPYLGYGTREKVFVKGRVLRDKGITAPQDADSIWLNLLNMYKRYESDEIPHARVRARFGTIEQETEADEEGYYTFTLDVTDPLPENQTLFDIQFELISYPGEPSPDPVQAVGQVLIPPTNVQFGIISDIDDTVVRTDAVNLLKMARNVFLNNARTRLPFEGVAAFYKALQIGTANAYNPIFYLSSSSWNLYDLLVDFFNVRGIPPGPLFLVDLGLTPKQFITPSHEEHKLGRIQKLMTEFPQMKFILIGDSGQHDPEIYLEAAVANPGRVLAIYIRDVTGAERNKQVTDYGENARKIETEMILVKDTAAASLHATSKGFILPQTLPSIEEERTEDKKEPVPAEKLLDEKDDSSLKNETNV